MAKFSPITITSPYNLGQINANFNTLSVLMQQNVMFRRNIGVEPNTLEQHWDINGFRLYNGGWPINAKDYVTKEYVDALFALAFGSLPPGIFPGGGNGGDGTGGGPGGIGEGDGGYNTPVDPTVNKPSITSPTNEQDDVKLEDDATSSAFGSTNGQTHAMSRWMIEQRSTDWDFITGTSSVIYDSGATATFKTTLPFEETSIGHEFYYVIRVRHKGSNGGWGPWSDDRKFYVPACVELFTQNVNLSGVSGTQPFNPPTQIAGWTEVKAYLVVAGWDDAGDVVGSLATVVPNDYSLGFGQYLGSPVLIHDSTTTPLIAHITDFGGGSSGFTATIEWYGKKPLGS